MNLSILIVFYNASPLESKTLRSILAADLSCLGKINLTVWNNGPRCFSNEELADTHELFAKTAIDLAIYNTEHNFSLSTIYNFFLDQSHEGHSIIFDHDSSLQPDFFTRLAAQAQFDLILPLIMESVTGEKVSPLVKETGDTQYRYVLSEGHYTGIAVTGITSGICFSQNLKTLMTQKYQTVFHESFALYAIDACFFLYVSDILKQHELSFAICNKITHSLSKFQEESLQLSIFRKNEFMYGHMLLRLHTKKRSRRAAISYLIRKCLVQCSSLKEVSLLCKCIMTKRHPRLAKDHDALFVEVTRHPIHKKHSVHKDHQAP